MTEHTKEPWRYSYDPRCNEWDITAQGDAILASFTFEDDAARAIACVNTLANLDPSGIPGLVEAVKNYVNTPLASPMTNAGIRRAIEDALALVQTPEPDQMEEDDDPQPEETNAPKLP